MTTAEPATTAPQSVDLSVEDCVRMAAVAINDKQGANVVVIDVGAVLSITDYFIIASAQSGRQVRAIVDEVERQLGENAAWKPTRIEGLEHPNWVLMDYGAFVVHVFDDETRLFYDLERLWRDMPRLALTVSPTDEVPHTA